MSRRGKGVTEVRCGVLSWFSYKKRTLLHREAFELSPLYWKCCRRDASGLVYMHGYRSEQSRSGKPRVTLAVYGCTTELLPPMLRAKGKDYPGNDYYICLQTDDDRIVFLKAEGSTQRDLWFEALSAALDNALPAANHQSTLLDPVRSPARSLDRRIQTPTSADQLETQTCEKARGGDQVRQQDAVYHLPYQDIECTHYLEFTDEDTSPWTTKPLTPSMVDLASSSVSDLGDDDTPSASRDLDEDGYIFPLSKPDNAETGPIPPNTPIVDELGDQTTRDRETGVSLPSRSDASPAIDNPAATLRSKLLVNLKQAQESKPRNGEETTAVSPTCQSNRPPALPTRPPQRNNKLCLPSPKPRDHAPVPKATREVLMKPMKAPPPLPAGGNSKPRALVRRGSTEKQQDSVAEPPPIPHPKAKPRAGNISSDTPCPVTSARKTQCGDVDNSVRSFQRTHMAPETEIEIATETIKDGTLKLVDIKGSIYISWFGSELSGAELLVGDEIERVNNKGVFNAESAINAIKDTEGDVVIISVKRIPHGVRSYITRLQDSAIDCNKLGLTLRGNEVLKFDEEGLVMRSGIPSRQQIAGALNDGELGNWAITQINMTPVTHLDTTEEVESMLTVSSDTIVIIFQPLDFAQALDSP